MSSNQNAKQSVINAIEFIEFDKKTARRGGKLPESSFSIWSSEQKGKDTIRIGITVSQDLTNSLKESGDTMLKVGQNTFTNEIYFVFGKEGVKVTSSGVNMQISRLDVVERIVSLLSLEIKKPGFYKLYNLEKVNGNAYKVSEIK